MTIISHGIYVLYVVKYILWNLYSLNNKKPKGSVGKIHPLSQMRRHIFFKLEVLFHFISLNELFNWTDHARILVINELKWTRMGEFNSDNHYMYYCGQEFLRTNGVAFIVNKRAWIAVLGCSLKNNRMISVRFQGKPFNITVIQAYTPNTNVKEAEVEWFYEDLQDLLELTPPKDVLFIIGDWNAKVGIKKQLE